MNKTGSLALGPAGWRITISIETFCPFQGCLTHAETVTLPPDGFLVFSSTSVKVVEGICLAVKRSDKSISARPMNIDFLCRKSTCTSKHE